MPDLELALLPVRERADERVQRVAEPDALGRGAGALALLALARGECTTPQPPAVAADDREVEVVLDRQPGEEPGLLVRARDAQPRAHARGQVRDVGAHQVDRAARGLEVPGDQVEQRRLARAVRAQDGAALAVRDVEIDVAHGLHPAEAPADPPQAEDRAGALGSDGQPSLQSRVSCHALLTFVTFQGTLPFLHAGTVSLGGGFVGENAPPKRLRDADDLVDRS